MGSGRRHGLKNNILIGRWDVVRTMLLRSSVQERVRTKRYKYYNKQTNVTESGLTALHLLAVTKSRIVVPIDIIQQIKRIAPTLTTTTSRPNNEIPLHYFLTKKKEQQESRRRGIWGWNSSKHSNHIDCRHYDNDMVWELTGYGCGIMVTSNTGDTPLHIACKFNFTVWNY